MKTNWIASIAVMVALSPIWTAWTHEGDDAGHRVLAHDTAADVASVGGTVELSGTVREIKGRLFDLGRWAEVFTDFRGMKQEAADGTLSTSRALATLMTSTSAGTGTR